MSSIGVLRLRAGVGLLECIQISFGRGFELREIRIGFVLVLLDRLARFHNHFVATWNVGGVHALEGFRVACSKLGLSTSRFGD